MYVFNFIRKNALRNRRRTALTLLSVAASLALLTLLLTVEDGFRAAMGRADSSLRVSVRHRTSFAIQLPIAFRAKIEKVPGVVAVCPFVWYGGSYRDPREIFPSLGCDPGTLRAVWGDQLAATEAEWACFHKDRMGAMVAELLANRHGWKVGDTVALRGRAVPVDLTFHICGVFTKTMDPLLFVLRYDYVDEAMRNPGDVGNFWLKVDSAASIPGVIRTINEMFTNSPQPVVAETEKTFLEIILRMMNMFRIAILAVGAAVVASIMLVTANTIAMSVRERMTEVGVLRAMGFRRRFILAMLLGEACFISTLGGAVGSTAAWALCHWSPAFIPGGPVAAILSMARPGLILIGLAVSVFVGFAGGIIPALGAVRVPVSHAIREVV
ncbi:MAG: ABC transporter permease [Candidatus Riflebacteria bacterium]|nr:ABC transporter permease [Candidatus Riflebacteria bacterium]